MEQREENRIKRESEFPCTPGRMVHALSLIRLTALKILTCDNKVKVAKVLF